jgi:hypothetical protein
LMLPKSPTWRSESDGAPCSLPYGLTRNKCYESYRSQFFIELNVKMPHVRRLWGSDGAYSVHPRKCIHWCCLHRRERAFPALHLHHCLKYPS